MTIIEKAKAISDAKISFVSLVDKAANKRQFLITKAEDGTAHFTSGGRILKADADTHYITGVVYEPLVEDTEGNFMTEEEIRKAAYWYAKNGDMVDLQHSFVAVDGVSVVESYITLCDMDIDGELIRKGTWIITVEVENAEIWEGVEKGEITGFSMGGVGKYDKEDTDLANIKKGMPESAGTPPNGGQPTTNDETMTKAEKGVFKSLLDAIRGVDKKLDAIAKGEVAERYQEYSKSNNFWSAMSALENTLRKYDWDSDEVVFESDEDIIREAIEDFNKIITDLLTEDSVTKSLHNYAKVAKTRNKTPNTKKTITKNEEDKEMTYDEVKELVEEVVEEKIKEYEEKAETALDEKVDEKLDEKVDEEVKKLVEEAVKEYMEKEEGEGSEDEDEEEETLEKVRKMIEDAITPVLKSRGLPSNLNSEKKVEKSSEDAFDGFFI